MNTRLAINGGTSVRSSEMPSWPAFDANDQEEAMRVLQSGAVNQWTGDDVEEFESEFCDFLGIRYGVAVANGTVALELSLRALGIGEGDEVIVPARTFVATASAVVQVGAQPVVVDIERNTGNIDPKAIRHSIGWRTKAIIPVHVGGIPASMDAITAIAEENDLFVIEDCAQAHGAEYNGSKVGTLGDIAAWSFCQDKILTTGGEGGLVVTEDPTLWRRAWEFKDHGKDYEALKESMDSPGFSFLHNTFGTNWRLSGLQAAVGRSQLKKLPRWLETRKNHAEVILNELKELPGVRSLTSPPGSQRVFYKLHAFIDPQMLRHDWSRDRVMAAIKAEGVYCGQGICSEIYREQAFTDSNLGPDEPLPTAQELQDRSLMFLIHPTLSKHDIEDTRTAIHKVLQVAVKGI